jgi:nucleoside-diphosphate kinase
VTFHGVKSRVASNIRTRLVAEYRNSHARGGEKSPYLVSLQILPTLFDKQRTTTMGMEQTLIILKPDAVQRGIMGKIITRFEEKGLKVVGAKFMQISQELASSHYADHKEKPFYPSLVSFMTSSPVLVMALEGVGAIAMCRSMMGATFGSQAAAGTIRGDFGVSNSFNLIHGSDSPEAATKELGLFFSDGEVISWNRANENWVYDLSGDEPE